MKYSVKNKAQKGFTLIELVVVIVILGILAVTAAPKFINLQDDAHTATLNAIKASMQSASTIVHSKALIKGDENEATSTVKVNGADQDIAYGYPRSDDAADWGTLLDTDAADFTTVLVADSGVNYVVVHPESKDAPTTIIAVGDDATAASNCYAYYTEATGAGTPVVITEPIIHVVECL